MGPILDWTVGERFSEPRKFGRVYHNAAWKDKEVKRIVKQPGRQMKGRKNP